MKSKQRPMADKDDESAMEVAAVSREICERLAEGKVVRRTLPPVGSIFIDGRVPFLFVYRSPRDRSDAGTKDLVTSQAAYLFAAGDQSHASGLQTFCGRLAAQQRKLLGAFLLVEVWTSNLGGRSPGESSLPQAAFRITHAGALKTVCAELRREFSEIRFGEEDVGVQVQVGEDPIAPPGLPALLDSAKGTFALGIEVHPFWRDGDLFYPSLLRDFRAQFSAALRHGLFAFVREKTKVSPRHHHELGAHAMVKATRTFDQRLAGVTDAFDFLLQATPINFEAARKQFAASRYQRVPEFQYRPLTQQPEELKRQLFEIPLDRLEDPTIAFLLEEKQTELDRQLTALRDVGTPTFLYACLQLYGAPDATLVKLAEEVLARVPAPEPEPRHVQLEVKEVRRRALEHIARYRRVDAAFHPPVEIRGDIASGMLVSRGSLFISEHSRPSRRRLEALFQHEIGTHLLTYFNGDAQPFAQLRSGLAGYETLQEGLAVLGEWLVGGLTPERVRILAGRVLAAHWIVAGADLVETFRQLTDDHGFPPPAASRIAMRIFRGGGYIKDQIYLKGWRDLATYLADGHALEPLYVGKIALAHVPYIEELRYRRIIRAPRLLPRFLQDKACLARIDHVREATPLALLTQPSNHP